jgi:hypothetical protein
MMSLLHTTIPATIRGFMQAGKRSKLSVDLNTMLHKVHWCRDEGDCRKE